MSELKNPRPPDWDKHFLELPNLWEPILWQFKIRSHNFSGQENAFFLLPGFRSREKSEEREGMWVPVLSFFLSLFLCLKPGFSLIQCDEVVLNNKTRSQDCLEIIRQSNQTSSLVLSQRIVSRKRFIQRVRNWQVVNITVNLKMIIRQPSQCYWQLSSLKWKRFLSLVHVSSLQRLTLQSSSSQSEVYPFRSFLAW